MGDLSGDWGGFREGGFWLMNCTGTGVRAKAFVANEVCGVSPFFDFVFLSSESEGVCAWE